MYQFLAGHQLSLAQVKRLEKEAEFLTLCRNLNCNFPRDASFNRVVHKKIISSLKYKITNLTTKGIIYRWISPGGREYVFWPPSTSAWTNDGWDGDVGSDHIDGESLNAFTARCKAQEVRTLGSICRPWEGSRKS
jgi:hypothetical protein